jgi:ATP-binding cassette, subfamily B, multidrug efflux pump
MKSLRRMWRFVEPYRRDAFWAMLFLLGVVVADISVPRLTQRVIDRGITARDMSTVLGTSAMMLGVSVLSALFSIGNTILAVRVGQNVEADLRSAVVRKVQSLSFGNLDHLQTGKLLVRATSDVTQVRMVVMMSLRILSRAPLWLLGSVIMLALNSPYLVPMMVVLMLGVLGLIWVFVGKARPGFEAVQEGRERLNEVLQENLAGVRVVKAFVRFAYENGRFGEANDALTMKNVKVMQLLAFLHPTMMLIINLGVVGAIWLGGDRVAVGEGSVGAIVASFNYLAFSLFPLLMLAGMTGPLSAADASAERIFEVLDSEPDVQNAPEPSALKDIEGKVAFEEVCFSYDGEECRESVLKDVNFVAEPGQTIAILGATGSGKSSLIHLIPRFYDVRGGRVTLDGVDIRDLSLSDLRPRVGVAMQEAVLFSGTIRDNIRYGRPDATDDEVVEAAKAAQAHHFIVGLPEGYDTMLGQRGVNLSGGQKQRISIARALLVHPRILILDDSTSAVDFETEAKIEAALAELLRDQAERNTTIFVVAQRISTVLNADKIVVLDKGRISAMGTHEELMATSHLYQEIYDSQLGDRERLLAA